MVTKVVHALRGPSGVTMETTDTDGAYSQNVGNPGSTLITTKAVTVAENGTTFFLSLAGGFTTTIPDPFVNGRYKFIVKTAPTTDYILATTSGDAIMIGGINELEVDTASDGPYTAAGITIVLEASVAAVGDYIELESDGVSWYFKGQSNLDAAVTFTT